MKEIDATERMILYDQGRLNCTLIRRRWGLRGRGAGGGVVVYLMTVIGVRYEESCDVAATVCTAI